MARAMVVLQKQLEDRRTSSLPRSLCRNPKNLSARTLLVLEYPRWQRLELAQYVSCSSLHNLSRFVVPC